VNEGAREEKRRLGGNPGRALKRTTKAPEDDGILRAAIAQRESYFPFHLVRLANGVSRSASRTFLKLFGVGVIDWRIIALLRVEPGALVRDICEGIDLDRAAASRSIHLLKGRGILRLEGAPGQKNNRRLYLTESGSELHDRIMAVASERQKHLMHGFAPEEQAFLLWLFKRMTANLARLEAYEDELLSRD